MNYRLRLILQVVSGLTVCVCEFKFKQAFRAPKSYVGRLQVAEAAVSVAKDAKPVFGWLGQ